MVSVGSIMQERERGEVFPGREDARRKGGK